MCGAIFDASFAETQYRDRATGAIEPLPTFGCALLDRDRKASDQPRHFVELSGIMILDGPRKPRETFVIAHGRHVVWNDGRNYAIRMNDGHSMTSRNRTGEASIVPEYDVFWSG